MLMLSSDVMLELEEGADGSPAVRGPLSTAMSLGICLHPPTRSVLQSTLEYRFQSQHFAGLEKSNIKTLPNFYSFLHPLYTIDRSNNTQPELSASLTTPGADSTSLGTNFTINGFFFQINQILWSAQPSIAGVGSMSKLNKSRASVKRISK
jgi:hypothetical protein